MKHFVKDNKDVIFKGEIYRPLDGIVDLPEKIENEDVQPIEESKEDELEIKSYDELKAIATELSIEFAGNISKSKLIEKIREAQAQAQ